MFPKTLAELARLVEGKLVRGNPAQLIENLTTDTRLPLGRNAVFLALRGRHYHGARFVEEARSKGAKAAIVDEEVSPALGGIALIRVGDSTRALQALAHANRRELKLPILAISGSNGKTILKDFLATILNRDRVVFASPGSFNSQVGVAFSLLRLRPGPELAIIEAGISQKGEMTHLARMIQPDFGILTNIGMAHFEGFGSRETIMEEKLILFQELGRTGWLLLPPDPLLTAEIRSGFSCPVNLFNHDPCLPRIQAVGSLGPGRSVLKILFPEDLVLDLRLHIDYSWSQVFETLAAGLCAAYRLGLTPQEIVAAATAFEPPLNRIEIWKSRSGAVVVNDSYSSDPVSTLSCLNVLDHYQNRRKVFIFGGMKKLGRKSAYEHRIVGESAVRKRVDVLITVGDLARETTAYLRQYRPAAEIYEIDTLPNLIDFVERFSTGNDVIVVKGPRELRLEQISKRLKTKLTQTAYYINLSKIKENLFAFREFIPSGCGVMVMLKAFAYGMDAVQIARFLQPHVDYFGVAYVKEAVALRGSGIHRPILVQMVLPEDFEEVIKLSLQPVLYDREIAASLACRARELGRKVAVHIKVDTGLGRFGVFPHEVGELAEFVHGLEGLEIAGLMTHLSSASNPREDEYTKTQIRLFRDCGDDLKKRGINPPLIHAANTSGCMRFPEAHFDMIRLGLGIYGINPVPIAIGNPALQCPIALVSKIGGIRTLPRGHPISYGKQFFTERESRIALLPIGYHDGLSSRLSKVGYVKIRGRKAPIVGAICMDFTMVDVTDIPAAVVGDPALIFGSWRGEAIPVEEVAELAQISAHNLLCRLSDRIQRIYILEDD